MTKLLERGAQLLLGFAQALVVTIAVSIEARYL